MEVRVDFPLFLKAFRGFFGQLLPPAISKNRTQIRDSGILVMYHVTLTYIPSTKPHRYGQITRDILSIFTTYNNRMRPSLIDCASKQKKRVKGFVPRHAAGAAIFNVKLADSSYVTSGNAYRKMLVL